MPIHETVELAEEKARFQGRIIASVSHELKNALATVSETAGLLSDIIGEAGLEGVVREESLSCAEAIAADLKRSFRIIRTLNTFAHTADESVCAVDVVDLVELVTTLTGYLSHARQMFVEVPIAGPIRIRTSPLHLEDLLYRVLDAASRLSGRQSPIRIGVAGGESAEITLEDLGFRSMDDVVSDGTRRLLDALHGELTLDPDRGSLGIRLPASIDDVSRTGKTPA